MSEPGYDVPPYTRGGSTPSTLAKPTPSGIAIHCTRHGLLTDSETPSQAFDLIRSDPQHQKSAPHQAPLAIQAFELAAAA